MKLLVEWDKGSLILEPEYTYILGRDETSDIHIDSPRISRAHARLSYKNKDWILEDLESSNGTFVGNKPVKEIKISKRGKWNLNYLMIAKIFDIYKPINTAIINIEFNKSLVFILKYNNNILF